MGLGHRAFFSEAPHLRMVSCRDMCRDMQDKVQQWRTPILASRTAEQSDFLFLVPTAVHIQDFLTRYPC